MTKVIYYGKDVVRYIVYDFLLVLHSNIMMYHLLSCVQNVHYFDNFTLLIVMQ